MYLIPEVTALVSGGAETQAPFGSTPCALTHCGPQSQPLMSPHPGQMRTLQPQSPAPPNDEVGISAPAGVWNGVSAPPRGGGPVTSLPL